MFPKDALPLFSDIFENILSIPQPIAPIQAIKAKYLENSIQHYSKHSKNPVDTTFAVKLHLQVTFFSPSTLISLAWRVSNKKYCNWKILWAFACRKIYARTANSTTTRIHCL